METKISFKSFGLFNIICWTGISVIHTITYGIGDGIVMFLATIIISINQFNQFK